MITHISYDKAYRHALRDIMHFLFFCDNTIESRMYTKKYLEPLFKLIYENYEQFMQSPEMFHVSYEIDAKKNITYHLCREKDSGDGFGKGLYIRTGQSTTSAKHKGGAR